MTTLKDILRDFQKDTIGLTRDEMLAQPLGIGDKSNYSEKLQESLEITIDIIIKNLIGGDL